MKFEIKKEENYLEGHQNSGLKVGDRVRIARIAKSFENGWNNIWAEESMDEWVGKVGTIIEDADKMGFLIQLDHAVDCDIFAFPYFVLEKVNQLTQDEAHRLHKRMWNWLADHPSFDKDDIEAVEGWKLEDLKHRCFLCEYYLKLYEDCKLCPLSGGNPEKPACINRLYGIWDAARRSSGSEAKQIKSFSARLIAEI